MTHTIDQVLWEFGAMLVEVACPSSRRALTQEQIAIHALCAFEAGGFAIRETDADGNLTWRAAPEMQAYSPHTAGGTVTIKAPSFEPENYRRERATRLNNPRAQ